MNAATHRLFPAVILAAGALASPLTASATRGGADTILGEVRVVTDLWTPMVGAVPVEGAGIATLDTDASGTSVTREWTRTPKTFSFDDAFLANGNLVMGGEWTWQPDLAADQATLVLGLPEAEHTVLDAVSAGSFQHGQLSEFWSWTGNGVPFAFEPFEAWVSVLNTRASQHAVDAAKGWGLSGTGQTLAVYVDEAVSLADDSGVTFTITALEGACIGDQAIVRTDSLDAVTDVAVDGLQIELSIRGGLDAGWNWFEVVRDPASGTCGALDADDQGAAGTGSADLGRTAGTGAPPAPDVTSTTPARGLGTCEPPAPIWEAPPVDPRCPGSGEYVGTEVFASCASGPALLCNGTSSPLSESWSYAVSANFAVGFSESVKAGIGWTITRTITYTAAPGECARPYACEKGKTSTYLQTVTSVLQGYSYTTTIPRHCALDQLAYAGSCTP